ncbi:DUF1638 domain-containing protein [Ornithinimicrobium avium]|uniref:DUF1638 domain-containing protein n=1 Tax=Ornithinimicrobium avium TaxID=2283195 RepID=A0A345NR06_9MICO|nr:DUF1638 domain-containing protein [Ornithinimicrobium avium]AXH97464.1 DUF1638 domain-containing protein [Ornithinimicrobium avium]
MPSSSGFPSRSEPAPGRVALVACGALAQPAAEVSARHTPPLPVDVHPLPPLLHNRPQEIAGAVERLVDELEGRYERVVIGYADCGTYGALDELCARRGLRRLPGLHCYDLYAGRERMRQMMEEQPGTYVLTDFLVRSFDRTVLRELGLDRHPELREDYFAHYSRVVWLAQDRSEELTALAERAAGHLGLPLEVVPVGHVGLERALVDLLAEPAASGVAS